jgi:hypothetical protein
MSLSQEDIRLCTIMRADATDPPGVVLNYHEKEQFHSLDIIQGRNNKPSSKRILRIVTNEGTARGVQRRLNSYCANKKVPIRLAKA